MKKINIILIAALVLLNIYSFKVINDLESRIDTTDDLVINNAINSYSSEIIDAVKDVDKYIVAVKAIDKSGSGFIYSYQDDTAYIVTAAHLVDELSTVNVEFNNYRTLTAEVVGVDEGTDIAVLKVNTNFNVVPAKLSKSSVVKEGEFVISVGASDNSNFNSIKSIGIVGSTLNFEKINKSVNAYIVSDTAARYGFSGGPLINISSEVIGMCVMESNSSDATYAITSDEIKLVTEEIIENGEASKYELGIKFIPLKDMEIYQKSSLGITADTIDGIYVYDVSMSFEGAHLGVKNGDIITDINDKPINNLEDYLKAIYSVEDLISVSAIRDGNEIRFESLVEVQVD